MQLQITNIYFLIQFGMAKVVPNHYLYIKMGCNINLINLCRLCVSCNNIFRLEISGVNCIIICRLLI